MIAESIAATPGQPLVEWIESITPDEMVKLVRHLENRLGVGSGPLFLSRHKHTFGKPPKVLGRGGSRRSGRSLNLPGAHLR